MGNEDGFRSRHTLASLRSMTFPPTSELLRAIDTLILLIEEKSGETYAFCDDCYEITNNFSRCSLCCEIACGECGNKELTKCSDERCLHALCNRCHEENSYQVCVLRQDGNSYAHSYNC